MNLCLYICMLFMVNLLVTLRETQTSVTSTTNKLFLFPLSLFVSIFNHLPFFWSMTHRRLKWSRIHSEIISRVAGYTKLHQWFGNQLSNYIWGTWDSSVTDITASSQQIKPEQSSHSQPAYFVLRLMLPRGSKGNCARLLCCIWPAHRCITAGPKKTLFCLVSLRLDQ